MLWAPSDGGKQNENDSQKQTMQFARAFSVDRLVETNVEEILKIVNKLLIQF